MTTKGTKTAPTTGTKPASGAPSPTAAKGAEKDKGSAASLAETAKERAREVAETAKDSARDVAKSAAEQVQDAAEGVKDSMAHDVSGVANALRSAAVDMRSGSPQERTIGQLAEGLADVSDAIRDKDLGSVMRDASDLARRKPVLFLGGAALLGFAASRFVKASRPEIESPPAVPARSMSPHEMGPETAQYPARPGGVA